MGHFFEVLEDTSTKGILFQDTNIMMLSVLLIFPLAMLANGCPERVWPECNWEEELPCWGGLDAEGCETPPYCFPNKNGMTGDDGTDCWSTCPMMCGETEVICPGGFYNGCPMGGYCAWPYGDCPAMCGAHCDYDAGEHYCDMGTDDNGCWMGNFCSTEECPAGTYGR